MSKQNDFYLTKEGLAELQAELDNLKTTKRKEVANALKEAKEFGDLSENTDWDDAKSRQLFIEGRISELDNILKHAKVIEKSNTSSVVVGSTVEVELENDHHTFRIVGSTEANPDKGKISEENRRTRRGPNSCWLNHLPNTRCQIGSWRLSLLAHSRV